MGNPLVSLITPHHNRLEYLIQCIDSFKRYNPSCDFEHIIVDNGSWDGSKDWWNYIRGQGGDWWKHVKYVWNKENLGDHEAKMQGLGLSRGRYLMTTDNDTYIKEPNFFQKFVHICDTLHDEFGVGAIMPIRIGTKTRLQMLNPKQVEFDFGTIQCGQIPFGPVLFYKREVMPWLPHKGTPELMMGKPIWKVWNIGLYDADWGTMLEDHQWGNQLAKYPKYFTEKKIPKDCRALERK